MRRVLLSHVIRSLVSDSLWMILVPLVNILGFSNMGSLIKIAH